MVLNPRHRGDCADFFVAPHQTARVQLGGPVSAIGEIEHAAARAGRTWNTQLTYVLGLSVSAITRQTSTMGAARRTGVPC
jgi:hypothetical protein